jgi:hypothetical protein
VEVADGVGVVVVSSARATCDTPSPMTAAAAPTAAMLAARLLIDTTSRPFVVSPGSPDGAVL